jgi:hypothetical protein
MKQWKYFFLLQQSCKYVHIPADQLQYTADYPGRMGNEFPGMICKRNM